MDEKGRMEGTAARLQCERWVFGGEKQSSYGNLRVLCVSPSLRRGCVLCVLCGGIRVLSGESLGESEETKLWLDFALDCGYLSAADHQRLTAGYGQVGAMLWTLMTKWESFA